MKTELGFLSIPDQGGPGVVLIHDVWGLYDHFEVLATRLSAAGFVTLAVDLYRSFSSRPAASDPGAWLRELSDPDALAKVQEAVDFLHAHPAVGNRGVGVLGFCMGGSFALLAGASVRGVDAIAPFYGVLSYATGLYAGEGTLNPKKKPIAPLDAVENLRCPMIAFYGAEDAFVSLEDVRELERRAQLSGAPTEVHVYDGAGHAFANDTRPLAYRPDAAQDAWARMLAFFGTHLGATKRAS